MALQRTRGLSAAQVLSFAGRGPAVQILFGSRSPLNAVALGAYRRPGLVGAIALLAFLATSGLARTTSGQVVPAIPLAEAVAQADVVATVAVQAAEQQTFNVGGFVVEARVIRAFKGTTEGDVLYIRSSGNWDLKTARLVFLRRTGKCLLDVSSAWFSSVPVSRFPPQAEMFEQLPNCECPVVYRGQLDATNPVVYFPKGCIALPTDWKAGHRELEDGGAVAWVAQPWVEGYLRGLSPAAK